MFLFHLKKVVFNGIVLCSFINAFSLTALSASPLPTDDNNQRCILVPVSPFSNDVFSHLMKSSPASYPELLELFAKDIELMNHYLISLDELTYQETIPGSVDIARDRNGDIWYIRSIDRGGIFNGTIKGYYAFERIASVVASNIHDHFAQGHASHVTIKFLVEGTAGNRRLLGTAAKGKNFKALWGGNVHYPLTNPPNLDEEYAIWSFLGMPVPEPSFIGFDDNDEKVARVDFDTAFTGPARRTITENCFKTTFVNIDRYKCDTQTVGRTILKFASDTRAHEIINECLAVLRILQIEDLEKHFNKIESFLSEQAKSSH